MQRLNDYYEQTIAGHYLSALVNADYSGLTDAEAFDLDAYMTHYNRLQDLTIDILDDEPSFTVDAVSGLHADCYTVRFYFTNHPQQQALNLD